MKLPRDEAEAVIASDASAAPAGYGLGRHGWVALRVPADADEERWAQLEEWIRTSYALIAPTALARLAQQPPRPE